MLVVAIHAVHHKLFELRVENIGEIVPRIDGASLALLAVGDDPDIGVDAGVVEQLLGQGDDAFGPIVLDDPFADVTFAGAPSW